MGSSTVEASPGKQPLWPINRLGGQETGNPANTMRPGAQGFPPRRLLLGPKALLKQDSSLAGCRCPALPTVLRGTQGPAGAAQDREDKPGQAAEPWGRAIEGSPPG